MTVSKQDITFPSGDSYVAGWLFLPGTGGAQVPGIAMAHGFGAVKEMGLEQYARRFAESGLAALVFDYRRFGASGGEPRQRLVPADQIEDYRNALTFLSSHPSIDADRLAVWGTSFSGGHVLHLGAHDPRVKAVVSQVPATDIAREARQLLPPGAFELIQSMIVQERRRYADAGGTVYITNAAPPGHEGFAVQQDQESYDFGARAPGWRNEITMCSLEPLLEYRPAVSVELIAPRPLLLINAEDDAHAPADWIQEVFDRAGGPKRLLTMKGGHYTVYNEPGATQAADAAADWFCRHLSPAE